MEDWFPLFLLIMNNTDFSRSSRVCVELIIVCLKINGTFYVKKNIGKTILLQTFIFGIKAYHVHIYLVVHKYFQKSVTIKK